MLALWEVRYDSKLVEGLKEHLEPSSREDQAAVQCKIPRHVNFAKHVKFVNIDNLHNTISSWMEPIKDTIELLIYFSSCGSELFRAALYYELQQIRESSLPTSTKQQVRPTAVPKQPDIEVLSNASSSFAFEMKVSELKNNSILIKWPCLTIPHSK